MNRKLVLALALTLLVGMLNVAFNIERAKASGTIYIRADGSIDPPTAPISTVDNVTYTLTGNITSDADGIVVERSNIIIDGNGYRLQGAGRDYSPDGRRMNGFFLYDINNVTITRTNIKGFSNFGICAQDSWNNSIFENNMMNNEYGIGILALAERARDGNNNIYGNNLKNNGHGIFIIYSSHNNISGNNMTDNGRGIYLGSGSSLCLVAGNNLINNTYSVELGYASDNIFYHNNFINNEVQVYDPNIPKSINVWDDGYPSGGNYWSDYTGVDVNMDGIGDSSYEIDSMNIDHYPLMGTFSDFPVTLEEETYQVTTVCNSTISAFQFDQVNRIIRFNVTGEEGIGFCRVCIPHALMEPPYTVTVDGHLPQYVNYTLYHNGTHTWIIFTYQHSTHQVVIVPEFPTWASMLLMLIVLTVATVIHKRRLLKIPIH